MDDGGLCGNCNLGGIWDCSSSSSMCSQGNQSAKQQSRPRVVEPEGHTAGHQRKRSSDTFPYFGTYKLFRVIQNEPEGHTQPDTSAKDHPTLFLILARTNLFRSYKLNPRDTQPDTRAKHHPTRFLIFRHIQTIQGHTK